MTIPSPILKGRTELVEDAARIATAYLPVERDDPAKGILVGVAIMLPVWIALLWWLS